jgi:hypothetical protein
LLTFDRFRDALADAVRRLRYEYLSVFFSVSRAKLRQILLDAILA